MREDELDYYLEQLRNYGSLFLGDAGDGRLRRQGHRHQPRPADDAAPPATPAGSGSGSSCKTCTYQRLTAGGHAADRAGGRGDLRGRALRRPRADRDDAPARAGHTARRCDRSARGQGGRDHRRERRDRERLRAGVRSGRRPPARADRPLAGAPARPRGASSAESRRSTSTVRRDRHRHRLQATIGTVEQLDVLVNGAGANQPEPFTVGRPRDVRLALAAERGGHVLRLPGGRSADGGRQQAGVIVNISSQMGHVGAPLRTAYCATKHAVEGFTKALSLEAAAAGIRVVSIAPTFVRTPMTEAQLADPQVGPQLLSKIPLGRLAEVDQVAAAVVFAASDQAAMISGSSIMVDGAWTAQ